MRITASLIGLLWLGVESQDLSLDDLEGMDEGEGLNLLQVRSSKMSTDSETQEDAGGIVPVGENRRCREKNAKRAKFDSIEDCAAAWAGDGITYLGYWLTTNSRKNVRKVCLGWTDAGCDEMDVFRGIKNMLYKVEQPNDEAAAVGDPHLTLSSGSTTDMCCEGGVCEACDLAHVDALLQEDARGIVPVGENRRCREKNAKRAKFDSFEDCAAAWAGDGITYLGYWLETNSRKNVRKVCLGWTDADCDEMDVFRGIKNKLYKIVPDDDAAAVGDPHLHKSNHAKEDLCCDGGECHPCQ